MCLGCEVLAKGAAAAACSGGRQGHWRRRPFHNPSLKPQCLTGSGDVCYARLFGRFDVKNLEKPSIHTRQVFSMLQCKRSRLRYLSPGMQVEALLRARVARLERMEAAVAARRAAEAAVPVHWQRRAAGAALAVRPAPVLHTLAMGQHFRRHAFMRSMQQPCMSKRKHIICLAPSLIFFMYLPKRIAHRLAAWAWGRWQCTWPSTGHPAAPHPR